MGNSATVATDDGVFRLHSIDEVSPAQFSTQGGLVQGADQGTLLGPIAIAQNATTKGDDSGPSSVKQADTKGGSGSKQKIAAKDGKDENKKSDEKEDGKKDEEEFKVERFNVYGQGTVITQWNGPFRSPYEGTNSFLSQHDTATSETATLFLGRGFGRAAKFISIPRLPVASA